MWTPVQGVCEVAEACGGPPYEQQSPDRLGRERGDGCTPHTQPQRIDEGVGQSSIDGVYAGGDDQGSARVL